MPKVEDVVVVTGKRGGNTEALLELARSADPGSEDELKVNAWLVWQRMLDKARENGAKPLDGVEEGVEWLEWTGTLRGIVRELQIGGIIDDDAIVLVRDRISRWLRLHGCAVCISWHTSGTGNAKNEVRWAVRTEFREDPPAPGVISLRHHMAGQAAGHAERSATADGPRAMDMGTVPCPFCERSFKGMYYTRHVFREHVDPVEVLLRVIWQRGEVQSINLAEVLRQLVNFPAIRTSYIATLLEPIIKGKDPVIETVHGFGNDFRYRWIGPESGPAGGADGVTIRQATRDLNGHGDAPAIISTAPLPGREENRKAPEKNQHRPESLSEAADRILSAPITPTSGGVVVTVPPTRKVAHANSTGPGDAVKSAPGASSTARDAGRRPEKITETDTAAQTATPLDMLIAASERAIGALQQAEHSVGEVMTAARLVAHDAQDSAELDALREENAKLRAFQRQLKSLLGES